MARSILNRRLTLSVLALSAGAMVLGGTDALAGSRKRLARRLAEVLRAEAPMGIRRKNPAVVLPFVLKNKKRRLVTVQLQYGYDQNGDGIIATGDDPELASEYTPASQNRDDTRDTSKRQRPLRYRAGTPPGVSHAFSWNAARDLSGEYLDAQGRFLTTEDGRLVPDLDHPGDFLRETGETGVRYRVRSSVGHGRRKVTSEWVYSDRFTVNNNAPPTLNLSSVTEGDVVLLDWIAFDADSEDANGNGTFDLGEGEDVDQDGDFDLTSVSVAFDFHRLAPGEDPARMTETELESLSWRACTRREDAGGPNLGVESTPLGTPHVFAWDWSADPTALGDQVILRARGYDGHEHGRTEYWLSPISLGALE